MRMLKPTLHALRMRGASFVFVSDQLRVLADVPNALVQPMGIDLDHFMAIGRSPTELPTIGVIARLVPVKGVDVALSAFSRLESPAQMIIAGDGTERDHLERMANRIATDAVPPTIRFLGEVDTPGRDQVLRESSVIVIPSRVLPNGRTEGTPRRRLRTAADVA